MYKQIELPFESNALEPYIDALTVETHHGKHHATYTKTLNDAVEKAGIKDKTIEELLSSLDEIEDPALRKMIRNNGGGFYNHNLYFSTLSPTAKKAPEGALKAQIEKDFGSVEECIAKIKAAAMGQFGSGWAYLNVKEDGSLCITQSPNQDTPYTEKLGVTPIMTVDVWEHAYYLNYKNLRASYVDALFEIIDWAVVEKNFEEATK